jgi:deoxyadenosine/deoxycytidine kinase
MAKLFENPRFIAIEGPIRAGKSTLAALLAQEIGATRIVEPQQNPFLSPFYRGERSAAFPAQMWFLMSRYEQLCAAAERDAKSGKAAPMVADYIFEKDKLFANLNLSDDELALYERQFQYFRDQLPTPDLVIYLQTSPKVLRTRLARKGVPEERAISGRYLEQVAEAYEHFFFHYTASDLLVVNTDDIDFVRNNRDLQTLLRRLKEPVRGTQYFLPLGKIQTNGMENFWSLLKRGISDKYISLEPFHVFPIWTSKPSATIITKALKMATDSTQPYGRCRKAGHARSIDWQKLAGGLP